LASEGKLDKDGKPGMLQAAVFVPAFWDEIRVTQPPQALQRIFFALLNPVSRLLGVKGV
jgi:hypothetical protein